MEYRKTIFKMKTYRDFLPVKLLTPIYDPEKNPTPKELTAL